MKMVAVTSANGVYFENTALAIQHAETHPIGCRERLIHGTRKRTLPTADFQDLMSGKGIRSGCARLACCVHSLIMTAVHLV